MQFNFNRSGKHSAYSKLLSLERRCSLSIFTFWLCLHFVSLRRIQFLLQRTEIYIFFFHILFRVVQIFLKFTPVLFEFERKSSSE